MTMDLSSFKMNLDPKNPSVVIDGVDLIKAGVVSGVTVESFAGDVTRVTIEYPCEVVEVEGEKAYVVHFCPLGLAVAESEEK